ncbi:MAG: VWA domain-containing protein, partial [Chloroflexota bacterium]|nr:VWA domain-containing protein [Chloroflexota bacterium]
MVRYRYSQWDGTQDIPEMGADQLMDVLSDSLTSHGDVWRALQKLFRLGLEDAEGRRLPGIQDLLQRLRGLKRQTLDRYNIGSILDEIRDRLDDAVNTERDGIEKRLEEARTGQQSEELVKALENVASKNLSFLDNLPPDLPGAIKEMASYEFIDPDARQKFEELMDMLRKRVMDSYFKDIQQNLMSLTPEDMQRLKDMVNALNQMLRDRMQGLEPDFEGFMEQFGDQFGPERPSSLDDLIDMLRKRMAQMESLLNSLPTEARQSLEQLVESMLQDQGLRDELLDLAAALEYLSPRRRLGDRYQFQGEEPLSLAEALRLMEELQGMDELERQLERNQYNPSAGDIDAGRVRQYLGEDAFRSLEQLQRLTDVLEEAGYIYRDSGGWRLTPRGIRRLGQKALRDVFSYLKKGRFGKHEAETRGVGGERSDDTKAYEFGDSFLLDIQRTMMNSLRREGVGTPIRLRAADFEVYETEHLTQCS